MRPLRRVAGVVALALVALAAPATARRDRVAADVVKAARLLNASRLAEARALVPGLVARAPTSPEVRWLEAELAFLDGDYPRALERLDGVPDDTLGGLAGQTRRLVTSTHEVTRGFVHKDSPRGRFTIYYPPGPEEVIVDLAGEVLDAAWEAIGDDLGWRPTGKVRVELLAAPSDLARVSTLTETDIETTGTIALAKYQKLMVVTPRATLTGYPWMDTLAHEYTHHVIAHASHDTVPVWLHEGLARFQQTRWRGPPSSTLPAVDQQLLATALARRRLIDLDAMHPSMAKLPSQEAAALAYAEVFTLVAWLHGKVGYAGLRQALAMQRDGKSARRALAEVVGTTWVKLERDWKAHLRTLDLSAGKAAPARGKRVRFDKGGGRDENVGVDEVASAKARRFARLGGMLRAEGMLPAAAIEYEKALAAAGGADPWVAGKLARVYVELGQHDRAIALARPLLAVDEHDPVPAVTLGVALLAGGDHAGARDAFEQALRVSPFDPAVRCGLATAHHHLGAAALARRERAACDRLRN
ncbi:MAG: tetratricopeptide repeat protein [Kofleriaceae bacterium]|nr:tetratricopeptide repeat protein [Kofleriaceae bacterium]MCL4223716.1 tetratricopeptide repeat protein [Myxococcales bacterium]